MEVGLGERYFKIEARYLKLIQNVGNLFYDENNDYSWSQIVGHTEKGFFMVNRYIFVLHVW